MSKRVSSIVFVLGCSLTAVAYLGGCSSETEAGENTEQGGFLRVADASAVSKHFLPTRLPYSSLSAGPK